MKKNIFFSAMLALTSLGLSSCGDKETEGLSHITYYPTIELKGESLLAWEKGVEYVDPGYTSIMNGQDVTDRVVVEKPDVSKSGDYTVTYSITNDDGFGASASRRVIVYDKTDAVEGLYMLDPSSYRLRAGAQVKYGASYPISVIKQADGNYAVDDMLGGWYYYRAGYGVKYAMQGVISVAGDGTVSLLQGKVPGWNDGPDGFTGTFDAATGTFTLTTIYGGMDFVQTWVKQ